MNQPILALHASLRGPEEGLGSFRGAVVAAVSIAELSRYMAAIAADIGQTPFILVGRDRVLAHPALASSFAATRLASAEPLPPVDGFNDGVLAAIWTREPRPLGMAPFREAKGHWSWSAPDSFESNVYVYRAISAYGDAPWTVGVHFPGAETRRERWIVYGIGAGGLALLAFALAAAAFTGRRLGQPVLGLAQAARRVEALDFAGARKLDRGPVREINQAAGAFERMAAGLGWFETYLPKALVRRLMVASPGAPLSETREVTVMFTDLESYTDFSSRRPVTEVVNYLNELLARVGPVIENSGGTIDKYIGDSIMAFWGAPEEQSEHARMACHAACAIVSEVEAFNAARRARGEHACRMRIGLHTGPVAVGNIGFSGRVDYTIIGRTVNVAQRLEQSGRQVAKDSEVVILASGQTHASAGEAFVFERCATIEVDDGNTVFRLTRDLAVQARRGATNTPLERDAEIPR